ncbi:hypothetical protein TREES_T100020310 [Tupaia chinensis]|uniref:Uncharacterized protein n=1 Tax=Tupaia chinensis TaxID=246437 RepID=L9L6A7_TUPCH|nr:hypothetical protein TREES_T100020310 [Tupaia chinensis]
MDSRTYSIQGTWEDGALDKDRVGAVQGQTPAGSSSPPILRQSGLPLSCPRLPALSISVGCPKPPEPSGTPLLQDWLPVPLTARGVIFTNCECLVDPGEGLSVHSSATAGRSRGDLRKEGSTRGRVQYTGPCQVVLPHYLPGLLGTGPMRPCPALPGHTPRPHPVISVKPFGQVHAILGSMSVFLWT